jgi:SAM-dependent methyltransferase
MKRPSSRGDYDDDDEDVLRGLVSSKGRNGLSRMEIKTGGIEDDDESDAPALFLKWRWATLLVLGVMSFAAVTVFVTSRHAPKPQSLIHYSCPAAMNPMEKVMEEDFERKYVNGTKSNLTEFLATFREGKFDDWGKTYEQVKEGMYHWKSTHFPPNLNNGDSIYESACGVGLNLYMTLEIVNEVKGIESLVVYGNEYLQASTEKAEAVFDNIAPYRSVKGKICRGDSTDLRFVPSNAFDLVYTGYLSPLSDPLHLNKSLYENYDIYEELCEAEEKIQDPVNRWKSIKLSEVAQKLQNNFYGKWVSEMVRIAKVRRMMGGMRGVSTRLGLKLLCTNFIVFPFSSSFQPGKAVIIEQVSKPYCQAYFDWGGVAKEFWKPAINEYKWDVDPGSLVMEKDKIFRDRYHVFMRKNPAPTWG